MMYFVFFFLGLLVGVLGAYIYLKLSHEVADQQGQRLEARLQSVEEQVSFLALQVEDGQKAMPLPRTRKKTAPSDNHQKALSLLADGSDPGTVARTINMPLGQVQLLNKLYRKE
ncbi:MAG: hypothetical protein DDT36_00008 [Firmicutes bacterium]|nr:hypothetical protein [Bacillota bacterium]